jgi:Tfp pilus assembly protein PilV
MRQTASRLNRTWLTVLGILLLLAGAAGVLLSTGRAAPLVRSAGSGWTPPQTAGHLVGSATASALALTWVVLVTAVVAVVVGLLGLLWLLAQVPRTNQAKPFRLHDDAQTGLTRVDASVITRAVEAQVKNLPGVSGASAVLRGSASEPDLTLRVTADDRTDIARLLRRLHDQVAVDVGDALDTRLHRLGVQVEVSTARSGTDHITV